MFGKNPGLHRGFFPMKRATLCFMVFFVAEVHDLGIRRAHGTRPANWIRALECGHIHKKDLSTGD